MTARQTADPAPEFSLVVRPSEIGPEEVRYTLEASAEERAALADRFGLVALDALTAEVRLDWLRGHRFLRLEGRLEATVVQSCVVTLEPVRNRVEAPLEILFSRDPAATGGAGHEVTVELDDVEPLEDDRLDIGEVVAEELALSLDPYPRAPGASLDGAGPGVESNPEKPAENTGNRPFEVLARLKRTR